MSSPANGQPPSDHHSAATKSAPKTSAWQSLSSRFNDTLWVRLFPFLRWLPLSGDVVRGDLIAGIIGALVLVPKAMAYAQLSGLPVYHGLYAAFIPAIIGALWGSSRQLLTGPVAVVSLMTASALVPLAIPGSTDYVGLALLLALLVGVIQISMGAFRLGTIVNFLSHPVIIGFINAAAIIIALSQVNKLLGIPLGRSDSFLYDVWGMFTYVGDTHLPTLLMGLLAFAIMIGMKKFTPPGIARTSVLVAVVVTILVSWLAGFEHVSQVKIGLIADRNARGLVTDYARIEERARALSADIAVKSAELRELHKASTGETRSMIALKHNIDLLRLELSNKEQELQRHQRAVRKLHFELASGDANQPPTLYLAGHVPAGVQSDGRRWHIKKIEKGEMKLAGGGEVVGSIPSGLPSFSLPKLSWDGIVQLMSAAFIIALVAFMESISMAKAIAARTRQRVEPNQELIGQGLANVTGSFFQSYPVSGSFTGSAINLDAGAKTGIASVFNGLFVAVTLLLLTPLLYYLPQTVLSAIIIMACGSLLNFEAIRRTWRANRQDGVVVIVSFMLTLVFAPHLDKGVLAGAGLALVLYLYRTMQPRVAVLARHPDGTLRDAQVFGLKTCEHISVIRFDGQLYFANTSHFEDKIMERVALNPDLRYVIVLGDGINHVDAAGEETLAHLTERLHPTGIEVLFVGLKKQVVDVIVRTGLYDKLGAQHFFRTDDLALEYAWQQLGNNHEADCPLNIVCPVSPPSR
ncbi:MAG: SulP family inorganic anion transporter [Pseudomonadota bacterium]